MTRNHFIYWENGSSGLSSSRKSPSWLTWAPVILKPQLYWRDEVRNRCSLIRNQWPEEIRFQGKFNLAKNSVSPFLAIHSSTRAYPTGWSIELRSEPFQQEFSNRIVELWLKVQQILPVHSMTMRRTFKESQLLGRRSLFYPLRNHWYRSVGWWVGVCLDESIYWLQIYRID